MAASVATAPLVPLSLEAVPMHHTKGRVSFSHVELQSKAEEAAAKDELDDEGGEDIVDGNGDADDSGGGHLDGDGDWDDTSARRYGI